MREIEGELVQEHLSPEEAAAEMLSGGFSFPSFPSFGAPNVADLIKAHPYWSLLAALAAGMMLTSAMSGAEDATGFRFGRFNPLRRRSRGGAPAAAPIDPETKAAAEAAAPAEEGAPDEASGVMHWPNTKGMHYMNGGGFGFPGFRPPRFRGRVKCVPRHFRRLSPRSRVVVLGCLSRMAPEANAALFGVLDDDLLAPAAANMINANPAAPALLKALSDWHHFEHQKTRGGISGLGWSLPWSHSTTKLLASTVPGGMAAVQAHEVAKKAMKSGDLRPSMLTRAMNLVRRGKRGDRAALQRIAAVKKAAGGGNRHAEKALDTVKLAHAMSKGGRGGGGPVAFFSRNYARGLQTIRS